MSGELAVSFVLQAKDNASAAVVQASQKIKRAFQDTEATAKTMSQAAISAVQKLASAREILGIRSEKAIQNEIAQTEAAYKRLADSGIASTRELGRAQEAMRQKVAGLRQELEGVKHSAGGAGRALQTATGIIGAGAAAKMVVQGPISQTMAYDRALANLANTAYAGKSMTDRKAGMRSLDAAIVSAVRTGGGTRENALGTLDEMMSSGAFSDVAEAAKLLPVLTKAGTAANADPRDLARIAIRAKQTFGITDMSLALDQALRAGQLGGFELRDMAKWLPQQMAMATNVGMKGDKGFRTLLAANEAAAISAGTKDEAGNNVRDLLNEINTPHFNLHMRKIGVDANGSLLKAQAQGVNKLDATVNLVEEIVARDKQYQALKNKLKTASKDEQKEIIEAMAAQVKGTSVGKIFHNQQSLMALLGIMNNRDKYEEVKNGTALAKGTVDDNHSLIADTASYKSEQLAAEKAISMQIALDRVNPALGGMAEGITGLMREFPALSAAVVGTTLGVTALGAAALTAAGALSMLGGGGIAGAGGKSLATVGGFSTRAGAVGLSLAGGLAVGTVLSKGIDAGISKLTGRDESLGGLIYDMTHGDELKKNSRTPAAIVQTVPAMRAPNPERLGSNQTINLVVDGRQLAQVINDHNGRLAQRH